MIRIKYEKLEEFLIVKAKKKRIIYDVFSIYVGQAQHDNF